MGIFRAFHQRAWRKLVVEDTARLCDGTSNGDDSRDGDVGVDDTRSHRDPADADGMEHFEGGLIPGVCRACAERWFRVNKL